MRKTTIDARRARAHKSLWLSMLESGLTAGIMSMPIMTLFFESVGMSHTDISYSQMCFTVILLILNIPLGYVADRISRKWANIIGDLLHTVALLGYSQINGLYGAVLFESICGIGSALSLGVDNTLIEHFSEQYEKDSYTRYHKITALLREIFTMTVLAIGMLFGSNFRLCIAVSGIPHLVAAILTLFVHDDSPKLRAKTRMHNVIKNALSVKELRIRIAAYVVSRESTHGVIWIFSFLLKEVGVPDSAIALGWLASGFASICGNFLAQKYGGKMKSCAQFILPMVCVVTSSIIIGCKLNVWTIWLYFIFGIVKGWTGALALPPVKICVQREFGTEVQTTIESMMRTISELAYIPIVWFIGFAADFELRFGMLANAIIFLPAATIVAIKLRKFCKAENHTAQ